MTIDKRLQIIFDTQPIGMGVWFIHFASQHVDGGQFLAFFIDEFFWFEATPISTKVLFEEEGNSGATHGHTEYSWPFHKIENDSSVFEGGVLEQRQGVE